MTPRRSPLVRFALPQFERSFSDLLGIQSRVNRFDEALIEGVFEQIMWFGRTASDYRDFERTARAGYHFLQEGCRRKPEAVAHRFLESAGGIILALNDCLKARQEAEQLEEGDPDLRIEKYLQYYKTMYEGLTPIVASPVVYGFALAKGIRDKEFEKSFGGKVSLRLVRKMEKWTYQDNRLARGLNEHVRNAYAHQNYRILDDSQVELWDVDPGNQRRSWGPEIWHVTQLIRLCDQLWVNALGIICALVLYDVNNRGTMEARGWVKVPPPPRLRQRELEKAIGTICGNLGFSLESINADGSKVALSLSTAPEGIEQEAKIILGGDTWVDLFRVPIRYQERRVIDQLMLVLLRLVPYFEPQCEIAIDVKDPDMTPLGRIVTEFATMTGLHLPDLKRQNVDDARRVFKHETLGESTTFVKIEGTPRHVGRKRSRCRPANPEDLAQLESSFE